MNEWISILEKFILQAKSDNLKTSQYPKEISDFRLRVSFGQGVPARIPWMAFITPEMSVSKGIYPVYLYYKQFETLILAYGISETEEFGKSWPPEIVNSTKTITSYFDQTVPRYGDSFVFKSYKIKENEGKIEFIYPDSNSVATEKDIESDLDIILTYYSKTMSLPNASPLTEYQQGIFYMEKQLEDFIIQNWDKTEFGKKYDLIIEEGENISQQYKTDLGKIDILARDKKNNNYVVIELKKNQTSDDTVGQIARYMGWVKEKMNDANVKGIIIAATYDRKLDYALKIVPNVEVFLYEVDFKLREFSGV